MKKIYLLLFFLPVIGYGQEQISYAIVKDEPFNSNLNLNLELASLEYSTRGGRLSFSMGAWGSYKINSKIKTDFSFTRSLINNHYTFLKTPPLFDMNLGGNFKFASSTKEKLSRVSYSRESMGKEFGKETYRDNFKNYERTVKIETFEVKYIELMSKVQKDFGLRGGINVRSRSYYDDDTFDKMAKFRSFGIYAGLAYTRIQNLIVDVENHGRYGISDQTEWYVDAIIVPSNKFKDFETDADVTADAKTKTTAGFPIGFRVGYYSTEIDKKEFTGKKFGLAVKGEAGFMPYEGLFIKAGFAICILKR